MTTVYVAGSGKAHTDAGCPAFPVRYDSAFAVAAHVEDDIASWRSVDGDVEDRPVCPSCAARLRIAAVTPDWYNQALCRPAVRQRLGLVPVPSEAFMPPSPSIGPGRDRQATIDRLARLELVGKAVCRQCPVKADCEQAGRNEPYGLWNGRNAVERGFRTNTP